MNRIDICKNIIQSIKEYITNSDKLVPHHAQNHFIRNRKLSLLQVIMYLLYSSKASMFQNISRIHDDLPAIDFPTVSKQAVSKARQFISPDLFKELYYLSVDSFYSQIENRKLCNGYHLYAIDGSKFELPNSKSNFEFFFWGVKCSDILILPDDLPWNLLLLYMMYLMITLFMLHFITT